MSATTQPTPPTDPIVPPLISSSAANQATAVASSGSAAALVVILLWLIGLFHVTVPPEVAAAFVTLVGAAVHWAVIKYGISAS
jgi:glucan phosphoethanolaminetransferase (alkaline phosphatase superfamily)